MNHDQHIDHRRLGRELDLFDSDPLIGAGLPYWLPDGAAARQAVEDWLREVERRAGYQQVFSPVLGKRELYEISGHWAHYREDMFATMRDGHEELVLRPSLCPHHALIYRSRGRSYRDLPMRVSEIGGQFRAERSGVLGGLTRVRAMALGDAHVFCAPEQVADEVAAALDLIDKAYDALGLAIHRVRLSLRGAGGKYVADPGMWDHAEAALEKVLLQRGRPFEAAEGEGAFYGPKIDIQVLDAAGRESTLSTVQLDFHQPAAFDLTYIGADGAQHRPVMIHRGIVGSMERLFAQLLEVHQGAFPSWCAPVQLVVLPVSEPHQEAAAALSREAVCRGLRSRVEAQGTLGSRIRASRRAPYVAVVGAREAADRTVSLRARGGVDLGVAPLGAALDRVVRACAPPH